MLNLKNKTEREAFVNDYKNWTDKKGKKLDAWKSLPALSLAFYRYQFANDAVLIVTEYQEYRTIYKDYTATGKDYVTKHRFCLILPENDDYFDADMGGIYHRTYTLDGCSIGTVIDYMTKNKLETITGVTKMNKAILSDDYIRRHRTDILLHTAYEKYKKDWCAERGYDIKHIDEEIGVNGECYVCLDEFRTNEFQDIECMGSLLGVDDFEQYKIIMEDKNNEL